MLKEQARTYAAHYGDVNFQASNGWLDSFKKRNSMVFNVMCGEARDVDQKTVDEWHAKIPEIIAGYSKENIANCDETALFYRAIPQKSWSFKGEKCSGGKLAKERLSVLLCAFADGKFERPRCFKNIDVNLLPVEWHANRKAWMTGKLMEQWLLNLNDRMKQEKRKILLFMDNATSHPHLNLSNIQLVFFPANTTSVLQSMDQGVIYTTKVYYRKRVLSRLCREMDNVDNVTELCKTINVLDAVQWLASAVKSVSVNCVEGAFRKSGFEFPEDEENVVIADESELGNLAYLMRQANCTGLTISEYVSIDHEVYTECDAMDAIAIAEADVVMENESGNESEIESEGSDESQSQPREILKCTEMVSFFERLSETALAKRNTALLNKIAECVMLVEDEISKREPKQTSIADFFSKINETNE